jgi:hypothetical protein
MPPPARCDCPITSRAVSVDNDANVAALGEYRFSAGTGCDSFLYITQVATHKSKHLDPPKPPFKRGALSISPPF